MKSVQREDGWWITEVPMDTPDCGPYTDKKSAEEDRKGLQRTFDNWDNHKFWTCDI